MIWQVTGLETWFALPRLFFFTFPRVNGKHILVVIYVYIYIYTCEIPITILMWSVGLKISAPEAMAPRENSTAMALDESGNT